MHVQSSAPRPGDSIGDFIVAQVIGEDYQGRTWVKNVAGEEMAVLVKNRFQIGERRSLRLQRTFGWTVFAVMLVTYILDKWVF